MKLNFRLLLLCLCLLVAALPGQSLDQAGLSTALDKLMSSSLVKSARVSVAFYSPRDSSLIYGHRTGATFIPASLQKLYTGIAVLEALGPEHRFQTLIGSRVEIAGGILQGDLVIKGGGDPSWTEDIYPEGPHQVFELWADSLRALGITQVAGDLVGDISFHPTYPYNPLWETTDLAYGWAPAVAALSFNANMVRFDLQGASQAGHKAFAQPRFGYKHFKLSNQITTIADKGAAAIWLVLSPDNSKVTLQGKLGVKTPEYLTAAVRNPPGFTLEMLRQTLRKKGITISGKTRVETDPAVSDSLRVLVDFRSVPLAEVIKVMLSRSSNMLAESLLCQLAPSPDSAAVCILDLLRARGIPGEELHIADGSGLARQNISSAAHLGLTLCHAWHQDWFELFLNGLARPGEKGTLNSRMTHLKGKARLFGKTGTLRDVSNLAGYISAADGQLYAFVISCNGVSGKADAKKWQDRVCEVLLHYTGQQ